MKLTLFFQVLGLLLSTMNAFAQAVPTVDEFASSTPENAIQTLNATESMERIEAYVRSAVASKRLDLIKACYENQYAWRSTQAAIAGLTESGFKNSLTIMMLKSGSHYWPLEGELIDGSQGLKPLMDEPFVGLIKQAMPNLQPSDALISTRSARMKLAADLEFALSQAGSLPNKPLPTPTATQPENTLLAHPHLPVQPPAPKKTPEAKPTSTTTDEPSSTPWSIIVVVMIATAIGLLWLLLKRCS